MIPRARKAYELYLKSYGGMAAAYPQVLISQRTLFQLQTDYIAALENLWGNSIALKGFLLTDGLEAPSRSGEMDQAVRELNVPSPTSSTQPR
jgi:cobalt-zinc-cadmium efflux system outer membrane protein